MRRRLLAVTVLALAGCSSGLNRPVSEVTAKQDADGVQRVRVVAHSFYFEPNRVQVKVGVPVELTIKNSATFVPHNLSCPTGTGGMLVEQDVGMFRSQKVVKFTPTTTGEYAFFCHVDGHAKKGMKGTFVVVP